MNDLVEVEDNVIFEGAGRLLGGRATFKRKLESRLDAHEVIVRGLPGGTPIKLIEEGALLRQPDRFEQAPGVSLRTLRRRKKEASPKPLSIEQSGRAWSFVELLEEAIEVFVTQEEAEAFFDRPAIGLNQHRPIALLSTPAGAGLVEAHIQRLKYGVYA